MAAVAGFWYGSERPSSAGYGSATTQPWTIGWDENDTRIRLNLISRAWVMLRSAPKPEGGCSGAELVRSWPSLFPYCPVLYMLVGFGPLGMAVVMQAVAAGRPACSTAVRTLPAGQQSDHLSRTLLDVGTRRGPAVCTSIR